MSLTQKYVEEYLSQEDADRFSRAYQKEDFDEAERISKSTLKKIKLMIVEIEFYL